MGFYRTKMGIVHVSAEMLANLIAGTHMAALAIDTSHIAAAAITASKLDSQVITASHIADNVITNALMAANSIQGSQIAANQVAGTHMAAGAIDTSHIAGDAVTISQLGCLRGGVETGSAASGLKTINTGLTSITAAVVNTDSTTAGRNAQVASTVTSQIIAFQQSGGVALSGAVDVHWIAYGA